MELSVNIKKRLPGFTLNVSFDAGQDVMGLLGASGSGKSMTLRCIAGIEKPDEGRIVLNGRVLFDSERGINLPSKMRRVGYLFQNYALFPNMTVEENIGFSLDRLPKDKRMSVIQQKISMVKLEGMEKRYPFQLSGGQQQRAALARALAADPEVLLLDEPFSALDDNLRNQLTKQLIDTLSDFKGVTLFVTHNMEEAYKICSSLVVLKTGSVEASGEKDAVFQTPTTYATAKLTGCKNFSAARMISDEQVSASNWGVSLWVNSPVQEDIKHLGIRAHYIRQALEGDTKNVFKCWPGFISEGPFRVMVYLNIGRQAQSSEEYHLKWDITRERWLELKDQPLPWKIHLDPHKLMMFYS